MRIYRGLVRRRGKLKLNDGSAIKVEREVAPTAAVPRVNTIVFELLFKEAWIRSGTEPTNQPINPPANQQISWIYQTHKPQYMTPVPPLGCFVN